MKKAPKKEPSQGDNDMIDEALRESFPASDPPAWTLGTDRSGKGPRKSSRPKAARKA